MKLSHALIIRAPPPWFRSRSARCGSTSAVTATTAIAGKFLPISSRQAAPISGEAGAIGVDVGDVAGHPDDMLGPGAVLGEDGERVDQHLAELAGQIVGLELLLARSSRPRRR